MKTCYIFGGLKTDKLLYVPKNGDLIIAADKGLESVLSLSLKPDAVIGDFDSLGYVPELDNVEILPVRKDDTDVCYAVKKAFEDGWKNFVIYGCLGGELDHTVANIQLAVMISKMGGKSVFAGDDCYLTAVTDGSLCIKNGKGRVSVFAFDGEAKGVTLKGFDYPLENATLCGDFPLGVGNSFKEKTATVIVEKGSLVVISKTPFLNN